MVRYIRPAWFLILFVGSVVLVQDNEGLQLLADDHKDEVEKWRAEHEAAFRSPTGWLALTGHYWLKPGANRLGSSDDCMVKLPADAAKGVVGIFEVTGDRVSLSISSGGPLLADSQPVQHVDLPINASKPESDSPVKLEIGDRLKLQLVRRAGRFAVRVRDSQSELLRSFRGNRWFHVDPEYRIQGRYEPFDKPRVLKITNVKGDEVDSEMSGTLVFEFRGQTYRLEAVEETPGSLFITFRDRTSGKSTYGAGRFIDVKLSGDHNSVVIDFNKAYHPPCAWSPHTLCPLPTKQNQLPIAIESGEKQ